MATVFETRLIGNIGKDAITKKMDKGIIAINFPVAHNINWKNKKTGESNTKTTWVNCTIWKKEDANLRVLDFLKRGTLVDLVGTPYAKSFQREDGTIKSEIRLNVSRTNILKSSNSNNLKGETLNEEELDDEDYDGLDDFTLDDEDF